MEPNRKEDRKTGSKNKKYEEKKYEKIFDSTVYQFCYS